MIIAGRAGSAGQQVNREPERLIKTTVNAYKEMKLQGEGQGGRKDNNGGGYNNDQRKPLIKYK